MRNLLLAALAGVTLLALPARADEGAGSGRSSFYLELARDQARLRDGRAESALRAGAENIEAYARARAARRPAQPRR